MGNIEFEAPVHIDIDQRQPTILRPEVNFPLARIVGGRRHIVSEAKAFGDIHKGALGHRLAGKQAGQRRKVEDRERSRSQHASAVSLPFSRESFTLSALSSAAPVIRVTSSFR